MRDFKVTDFRQQRTDEGYKYLNCVMANGIEIQVEVRSWGWDIGLYDVHGRKIYESSQPLMYHLSGKKDRKSSIPSLMHHISKIYDAFVNPVLNEA